MSALFVPRSVDFVKRRASEVAQARPILSRTAALNVAAAALGFRSWFDAHSRIKAGNLDPSDFDEDVSPETRLWRRYRQGCALVDVGGFPPAEADLFVRYWQPTSKSRGTSPQDYRNAFARGVEEIEDYERGNQWHPWAQPPRRLNPDLLLTASGKYNYFVVSDAMQASIPPYVRGNASAWLDYECGQLLALTFPQWFEGADMKDVLRELQANPCPYQWATGHKTSQWEPDIQDVVEEAERSPLALYPLSVRQRLDSLLGPTVFLPMLSGTQFAAFMRDKGGLRLSDVVWYEMPREMLPSLSTFLKPEPWPPFRFEGGAPPYLKPTLPPYLSPFKHGPMFQIEFMVGDEGAAFALSDELDDPEDDGGDDGPLDENTAKRAIIALLDRKP